MNRINLPAHNEQTRAVVVLLNELNRHSIKLPPPVTEALADAQRANTAMQQFEREGTDAELADLFTELLTGGDDLEPHKLTRTILAAVLATRPGIKTRIAHTGASTVQRAIRDNGPTIIKAIRPMFDKAATALNNAATALGDLDLEDLPAITERGGDAAEHWKAATAAEQTIRDVYNVIRLLSTIGAYPGVRDQRERWLALVDTDLAGYAHIAAQTRPWELRRHGTLSLADAEELRKRKARIDEQWSRDPRNPSTRIPEGVGQNAAAYALMTPGGAL